MQKKGHDDILKQTAINPLPQVQLMGLALSFDFSRQGLFRSS
jgi:hypothetical protein